MAGLLIQGMEIPKACQWYDENGIYHDCRMTYGGVCNITGQVIAMSVEQRHPFCPLVALPEHSDLIDRKQVMANMEKLDNNASDFAYKLWCCVNDAPTIVKAST